LAIRTNRHQVERIAFEELGVGNREQVLLDYHARTNPSRKESLSDATAATLDDPRDKALGKAQDGTGVLIVGAHQDGACGELAFGLETEYRRDPFLILEG